MSEILRDAIENGKTRVELLDTKEAAKFLQAAAGTLTVWRCTKRYPLKYVRIGRNIRYRLSDLEAFLNERTVSGVGEQHSRRSRRRGR